MIIADTANPVAAKVRVVLKKLKGSKIRKHDSNVRWRTKRIKGYRTVASHVMPTRNIEESRIVATNRMAPMKKTPVFLSRPIPGTPAIFSDCL
jgi:hypothetical protein